MAHAFPYLHTWVHFFRWWFPSISPFLPLAFSSLLSIFSDLPAPSLSLSECLPCPFSLAAPQAVATSRESESLQDFPCVFNTRANFSCSVQNTPGAGTATRWWKINENWGGEQGQSFNLRDATWGVCGRSNPMQTSLPPINLQPSHRQHHCISSTTLPFYFLHLPRPSSLYIYLSPVYQLLAMNPETSFRPASLSASSVCPFLYSPPSKYAAI